MKCKEMEARKKRKWNEAKRTGQGAKGELHTLSSTAFVLHFAQMRAISKKGDREGLRKKGNKRDGKSERALSALQRPGPPSRRPFP